MRRLSPLLLLLLLCSLLLYAGCTATRTVSVTTLSTLSYTTDSVPCRTLRRDSTAAESFSLQLPLWRFFPVAGQ